MYYQEPLRIVLIGSRSFGCAVHDLIKKRAGVELVQVVAPTGDVLSTHAGALACDAITEESLPDDTDLIITAHAHQYISSTVIAQTTFGAIGYHPSLLPRHRGRDAILWAVRDNDPITGGSVYWLTDVADGGPIAAQDWCFIKPSDTESSLWRRELFPMGLRLLDMVLGDICSGHLVKKEQDELVATWEPAFIGKKLCLR